MKKLHKIVSISVNKKFEIGDVCKHLLMKLIDMNRILIH